MLPEGFTVHDAILALDRGQKNLGQALLDLRQEIANSGKIQAPRAQGIAGLIQQGLEAAAPLLRQFAGGGGDSKMGERMMQFALDSMYENIEMAKMMKIGVAKNLGITLSELPARHVVIHG